MIARWDELCPALAIDDRRDRRDLGGVTCRGASKGQAGQASSESDPIPARIRLMPEW